MDGKNSGRLFANLKGARELADQTSLDSKSLS